MLNSISIDRSTVFASTPLVDNSSCLDWKKVYLVTTVALILAAVARSFFLNMPLAGLGFSLLALGYLVLYYYTTSGDSELPTVEDYNALKKSKAVAEQTLNTERQDHSDQLKKTQELVKAADSGNLTQAFEKQAKELREGFEKDKQQLKTENDELKKKVDLRITSKTMQDEIGKLESQTKYKKEQLLLAEATVGNKLRELDAKQKSLVLEIAALEKKKAALNIQTKA